VECFLLALSMHSCICFHDVCTVMFAMVYMAEMGTIIGLDVWESFGTI
jgi:hypothetical protein